MSLRILLALAVLALDAWALDRVWRPSAPRGRRLRWTAAIVLLPVIGALLSRRVRPAAPAPPAPAGVQAQ
jgi:hypothetical protein